MRLDWVVCPFTCTVVVQYAIFDCTDSPHFDTCTCILGSYIKNYVCLTRQRGTCAERCVEKLSISMADHESFRLSDAATTTKKEFIYVSSCKVVKKNTTIKYLLAEKISFHDQPRSCYHVQQVKDPSHHHSVSIRQILSYQRQQFARTYDAGRVDIK